MAARKTGRSGYAVAAVCVLGLALRLAQLGEWSFWHDEALTILLARKPLADLVLITSHDVHPPLYFMVVKLFMLLGQGEWAVRLPSVLCSTACILGIYLVARDLFDERAGIVSATLMALSPLQLFYAQEARMYAQLVMLTLFACWSLGRALRSGQWRWWGAYALFSVLAAYTAYFVVPVLLAALVYVLLRRRGALKRFLLSTLVVIVLYAPWIGVVLAQTRAVLVSYWMERPSPLEILTTLCAFFVGYSLAPVWVAISLALVLFIVFVVHNSVRHAVRAGSEDTAGLTWVLLWAWIPLLGTFGVSLLRPIFQIRTVMTAAPAFYILMAWGLTRAPRARLHWLLFAPALLLMAVSIRNFYFDPAYAKPAWRQAAAYVNERARPGDVTIHTSEGSFLPFLCYDHRAEQVLLPEESGTAQGNAPSQFIVSAVGGAPRSVDDALAGRLRAWLVIGLDHAVDYQLSQKQLFDERFVLLYEQEVGGIQILAYVIRDS